MGEIGWKPGGRGYPLIGMVQIGRKGKPGLKENDLRARRNQKNSKNDPEFG